VPGGRWVGEPTRSLKFMPAITAAEFHTRHLAILSLRAKALRVDIAAEQYGTTPTLLALAREIDRTARQIAMPMQTEIARRRFLARYPQR
jgi:hypothetical protein